MTPFDAGVIETLGRLEERRHPPQTTDVKNADKVANDGDDEDADDDNENENEDTEHPRT